MKSSMMLFSENFGQRILIRRSYLAGEKTNIEAMQDLPEESFPTSFILIVLGMCLRPLCFRQRPRDCPISSRIRIKPDLK